MFEAFPKIPRLKRDTVVTEKIDGTNAQIVITERTPQMDDDLPWEASLIIGNMAIAVGSRTRWICPGKTTDNFGFAAWVHENGRELLKLGPGRHFGEWYGKGIQRGYGLAEKRFALFNTSLWRDNPERPACCDVVPVLYQGPFATEAIDLVMSILRDHGSQAVPGFMNPEGIIVYHGASRMLFKQTFDDAHKEAA